MDVQLNALTAGFRLSALCISAVLATLAGGAADVVLHQDWQRPLSGVLHVLCINGHPGASDGDELTVAGEGNGLLAQSDLPDGHGERAVSAPTAASQPSKSIEGVRSALLAGNTPAVLEALLATALVTAGRRLASRNKSRKPPSSLQQPPRPWLQARQRQRPRRLWFRFPQQRDLDRLGGRRLTVHQPVNQ